MSYAIKYYRDEETSQRWAAYSSQDKPPGYVIGQARFDNRADAQADADKLNSYEPLNPVLVVKVS